MSILLRGGITIIMSTALIGTAHAQSFRSFENEGLSETRAMVGITIPFGGNRHSEENKPRFDFRMQAAEIGHTYDFDRSRNPIQFDRRDIRQATVSLTFEDKPRFLLNGRSLSYEPTFHAAQESQGEATAEIEEDSSSKKERTTGQKVLRGAGFAAIATGIFFAGALGYLVLNADEIDGDG